MLRSIRRISQSFEKNFADRKILPISLKIDDRIENPSIIMACEGYFIFLNNIHIHMQPKKENAFLYPKNRNLYISVLPI